MIAEKFKFHRRKQHEGETVAQYLAEFQKFSEQCDFKEYLEEALYDRLVCRLRSEVIQRRLLVEENLTLKKAQELAPGMETRAKNACELQGTRRAAELRLQRDMCRVQHEVTMIVTGVENKTASPPSAHSGPPGVTTVAK